ncbi:MAG: HAMP domain-containing sensor histidine kinase [Candidatus Gracilibacteria bacterium]|nr:HAMP domain-containing sensor histidine kinase [Candidatus Gracilibacteria bacterium]
MKVLRMRVEKVKLKNLIIGEYDILQRLYTNIDFQIHVSDTIGFIEIDKIQFIQVISNLLNNSVKFLNNDNPIIKITANSFGDMVQIIIEDNGPGFNHGDEYIIFEKYSTGKGKSVGIGMGLYLCKKIVELHSGSIVAEKSRELGGAKFKITIPKNYNK